MAKRKSTKGQTRSTKHTYKTKDRVTRTPLKTGDEPCCSGRVSSSCSISDTRRVNLVTNPVINHERGKDRELVFTTDHVTVLFMHMLSFIFVVVCGLHDCLFMYGCIVVRDPINRFNRCRIFVPDPCQDLDLKRIEFFDSVQNGEKDSIKFVFLPVSQDRQINCIFTINRPIYMC